ncbi:MAG: hypothetical protein R3F05_05725 [Planctomycetota bacterium]|nr:hypothetical protein [Planctomycetota bacterium]
MASADATQPPGQSDSGPHRSPCCHAPCEPGGIIESRGHWAMSVSARWASGRIRTGAFNRVLTADLKLYVVEGRRCTACGALQLFANRRHD